MKVNKEILGLAGKAFPLIKDGNSIQIEVRANDLKLQPIRLKQGDKINVQSIEIYVSKRSDPSMLGQQIGY